MSDTASNPSEGQASRSSPGPSAQQPTPGAPMPQAAPGVGVPADLMSRFLARLIDYVLLFVVNMVIASVLIVGVLMDSSVGTFGFTPGGTYAAGAVTALVTAAIYLGYFAFMEARTGQTLGKMALNLRTRGPEGGNPTMEQALRRNAFTALGILGVIPVAGGLIGGLASLAAVIMIAVTINNNTVTRQGWHDQFAGGTSVIKTG